MSQNQQPIPKNSPVSGKVGSDAAAVHNFGGKGDFGIDAHTGVVKDHEPEIEGRPAGSAPGYSGAKGRRTVGVGSIGGESGHDSGGDIDPDWIGLDGHGGISAKPVIGHTDGADDAKATSSKDSRSGIKPGSHGVAPSAVGDYVDHSGSDTSTVNTNAAGSVSPTASDLNGAEGEISGAEATGNVEQGGEV